MKKVIVSLCLFILIIASSQSVFAARFESLGMKIDLPEGYYNLKSGVDTGDAKIEFYATMMRTTKEALASEYKQNGVLYNGINSNLANEIYISEAENKTTKSIFHLSTASEKQLDSLKEEIKSSITAKEMKVTTQEIYSVGEVSFLYTVSTKSSATCYQYYTIVNGTAITIQLNSSDSSAKSDIIKKMVDSISFDELQEKPADFMLYILIAVTAALVIMVLVLMYMAFFSKRGEKEEYEENEPNDSEE